MIKLSCQAKKARRARTGRAFFIWQQEKQGSDGKAVRPLFFANAQRAFALALSREREIRMLFRSAGAAKPRSGPLLFLVRMPAQRAFALALSREREIRMFSGPREWRSREAGRYFLVRLFVLSVWVSFIVNAIPARGSILYQKPDGTGITLLIFSAI